MRRSDKEAPAHAQAPADVPGRPPALCADCPHRLVFRPLASSRRHGRYGCYTLGALPPLPAMDSCIDMGASVSMSHGFELPGQASSIAPLWRHPGDSPPPTPVSRRSSALYTTKGAGTVCITRNNRTTAAYDGPDLGNPFNGETLQHRPSRVT